MFASESTAIRPRVVSPACSSFSTSRPNEIPRMSATSAIAMLEMPTILDGEPEAQRLRAGRDRRAGAPRSGAVSSFDMCGYLG